MKRIKLLNGEEWPVNTAWHGDCLDFMRLLPESSKWRRDTPAAVWRCWNLDFRGVDLLDEVEK